MSRARAANKKSAAAIHGRTADTPEEIPAAGWREILSRVAKRLSSDNVTLVAGGLAMYAVLSALPGLCALVCFYALFTPRAAVINHMHALAPMLPPGASDIFNMQVQSFVRLARSKLTTVGLIDLLLALWSSRSAMTSLMTVTNIAYREREKRSLVTKSILSIGFTAAAVVGFLVMLVLGVAAPIAIGSFQTSAWLKFGLDVFRLVLLWLVAAIGLALLYRYAPARKPARWRWVTWGSVIAASLWLGGSVLFGIYIRNFGGYGRFFGAVGGIIALLVWFFMSSFFVVLGAEINAETERQTLKDTAAAD